MKRDSNTTAQFTDTEKSAQNGNGAHSQGSPVQVQAIPVQNRDDSQEAKQQFRAILSAFRRRWFSSLTLGILFGGAVAAGTWYLIPAPFTAFAELRINTMQETLVFKLSEYQNFDTYKQTLSRKIKSPFVINSALDQVSQSDLEIVPPGEDDRGWLEQNIVVSSPAKEFLRIQISGEHPRKLKIVLDAVIDSFMNEIEDDTRSRTNKKLQDLRKMQSDTKTTLEQLNTSLKQLATATESANEMQLNNKKTFQQNFRLALYTKLFQLDMEILSLKNRSAYDENNPLKEKEIEIPESLLLSGILQHPDYINENQKNRFLEEQVEKWKEKVIEKHPKLVEANDKWEESSKKLESLKVELKAEVKGNIIQDMMARQDVNLLNAQESLRLYQAEREAVQKNIDDLAVLEKEIGINTFAMKNINKKIAKEEALEKAFDNRITSLETEIDRPSLVKRYRPAEVPSKRDVGKKIKLSAVAGFGGFGFIVFGIVFLEYRFRRISSIDEVADKLSMRVLGTLPLMPRSITKKGKKNGNSRSAFWHSALTESIDSTRTMFLREADLESMNIVMIASAMGGEGKTTLACHLSTSLARAGRNTILVDCDLRRPSVHKVYNLDLSPGFCEILRGEAKLEESIRESSIGKLSILPAGKINQDILGLLAQNEPGEIFHILKKEYDFVVVDSSPILPITDSLLIAQHVDAVMFAIRRDVSRIAKVGAAVQRMSMLGIPFLGAVAIGLDDESFGYNYPYKYQYSYGYGYRNAYLGYPTSRS